MQIEFDFDTKLASVSINDRPAQVWTDCDFSMIKEHKQELVDGWWTHVPTGERSFVLHGTVNA